MFKRIIVFILLIGIIFFLGIQKLDYLFFETNDIYGGIVENYDFIENVKPNTVIILMKGDSGIKTTSESKVDNIEVNNYLSLKTEKILFENNFSMFESSKILPILIGEDVTFEELESTFSKIDKNDLVITKFEFPKYDFQKKQILDILINFKKNDFQRISSECNNCLYVVSYLNKDSRYILNDGNLLFGKNGEADFESLNTILFLGDMMFDRGVEYYSKEDFNYPFLKINSFLKNTKTIFGNLEGPIVENPIFVSNNSMEFSFNKEIANVLSENNFNLVSLANNHTSNMRRQGLKETKTFLEEKEINWIGDPVYCSKDDIFIQENLIFYAVNLTFDFNCTKEDLIKEVLEIKKENPFKKLIFIPHWGAEYKHTPNDAQEELAHALIDNGVDLIIGGHSHVIGAIEEYKEKLIFYSLGNFIFDQYFSEETQESLVVQTDFYDDKVVYNLFITDSFKSQVEIIQENSEKLEWLASISSPSLIEEIKKGTITRSID